MSEKVSVITILHGETEFIPLIKHNYQNFNDQGNLELVVIDDGKENLSEYFSDLDNCIYLHLNNEEINKFLDQIEET